MKYSVIIPTYNRLEMLKRALASAKRMGEDVEVIVADDGSVDGTREYLERAQYDLHIVYHANDRNRGVNFTRNRALEKATGDWVVFLDDDDELVPEARAVLDKFLLPAPADIDIAYFQMILSRDGKADTYAGYVFSQGVDMVEWTYGDLLGKKGLSGDSRAVFRRSLFSKTKRRFPEEVNGFESYFFAGLSKDGFKIVHINAVLVHTFLVGYDHLSFTAARKNPEVFLWLNERMIAEHIEGYRRIPNILAKKYAEIASLSFRTGSYSKAARFLIRSFLLNPAELMRRLLRRVSPARR